MGEKKLIPQMLAVIATVSGNSAKLYSKSLFSCASH